MLNGKALLEGRRELNNHRVWLCVPSAEQTVKSQIFITGRHLSCIGAEQLRGFRVVAN